MLLAAQWHVLVAGEDLVAGLGFVPPRGGRRGGGWCVPGGERPRHMHLLEDVPPADAGVVGAERDLTLLRAVRNDAHLRAAGGGGDEILGPHAGAGQGT